MKFSNNDFAVITNTNTSIDGLKVQIVGVACQYEQMAVYIIQQVNPFTFSTGWTCMSLTEHCLQKIGRWEL